MAKLDLKDAYLTVPIRQDCLKYLRFLWEGSAFQFQVLPFGLASAPLVFTKLLQPVIGFLRQQGVRLLIFLDDILLFAHCQELLIQHNQLVTSTLHSFGFSLNNKKCIIEPTQKIEFLGFVIHSQKMKLTLHSQKVLKVVKECRHTNNIKSVTARHLAHVIGPMTSCLPAILPAPLHYRGLQRLRNHLLSRRRNYNACSILTPEAITDLDWWISHLPSNNGRLQSRA